jgi:hypothetical protein
LLPAGQERLNQARNAGGPVMTQMLSQLSPKEVEEMRGYLERCVEGLESASRSEAADEPVAHGGRREIRSVP